MRNKMIEIFMFPILFFILLLDGQISTLVTNWSVGLFTISSHLVLMLAIFMLTMYLLVFIIHIYFARFGI